MNRDEVVDVLTAAATIDHRTVGEADVAGWYATLRPDIDRQLGIDAVRIHYAGTREWIMPADVNNLATQIRKDRAERESREEREARQDANDYRHGLTAAPNPALGGLPIPTDGHPVWAAYDVNGAIDRPCPRCGAEPREACRNPITERDSKIPCLVRLTGKAEIA